MQNGDRVPEQIPNNRIYWGNIFEKQIFQTTERRRITEKKHTACE